MTITTAASVESNLSSALFGFKDKAAAVKEAHKSDRQAILNDPMTSDLAKDQLLEALNQQTRAKLDSIKADQDSYVTGLRNQIEGQLRGSQPTDANSVLLRRDASERARKITDKDEALAALRDAQANGDDSMAHALGNRARNAVWVDVAQAYQAAYPSTADSAAALAHVEELTSGPAYNLSNQITYADPNV